MRSTMLILLNILFFTTLSLAQNYTPITYDMSDGNQIINQGEYNNSDARGSISERIVTTSVVVGEVIILFLIMFYWKKTRKNSKVNSGLVYRKNITAIREERVKQVLNKRESTLRVALNTKIKNTSLNSKSLTSKAKKLSIAKGELLLAARIHQLQEQTR